MCKVTLTHISLWRVVKRKYKGACKWNSDVKYKQLKVILICEVLFKSIQKSDLSKDIRFKNDFGERESHLYYTC